MSAYPAAGKTVLYEEERRARASDTASPPTQLQMTSLEFVEKMSYFQDGIHLRVPID